jgi:polar amino acid transport system permease protein
VSALIVFGIIATVNMAEIYRGGMISIHHGQWEAAAALNLGRFRTYTDVIIPQMFRVSLPSAGTYLIGLLKDSSIASTIGVAELTFRGNTVSQMTFRGLEVFALVGVFYILASLPIAWISRVADHRLQTRISR